MKTGTDIRSTLLKTFEAGGGEWVEPPIVIRADLLVELTGESIRGRLCTFMGPDDEEWCLRPDMTSPIALNVAQGQMKPGRMRYAGPAFCLPREDFVEDIQFEQAGFEWFGGKGDASEDIEGVALTLEALAQCGLRDGRVRLGDGGLFRAFVAAFDLPAPWPERLCKAYSRTFGPRQLLEARGAPAARSPLAEALSRLPEADARAAVEDVYAVAGITPVGGRDAGDVAARLIARARENDAGAVPDAAARAICDFLDIDGPARKALDAVGRLTKKNGVSLDGPLAEFSARLEGIEASGAPMAVSTEFGAGFGRRFDYYDGLVFEVVRGKKVPTRPVASGGRYDGLVAALSEKRMDVKAFGAAVRPARLAEAVRGGAGA